MTFPQLDTLSLWKDRVAPAAGGGERPPSSPSPQSTITVGALLGHLFPKAINACTGGAQLFGERSLFSWSFRGKIQRLPDAKGSTGMTGTGLLFRVPMSFSASLFASVPSPLPS